MAKVAFIMDDMFEDVEFKAPYEETKQAGHEAVVVGLEAGKQLTGKRGEEKVATEVGIDDVSPDQFDALVIPGGYSPDKIRTHPGMVALTRAHVSGGKPVAVICHGPWMLAEADVLKGRTVTSWPSIKTDLMNAGANWVDEEVVEDDNLITSRKPDDLPAFCKAFLSKVEQST